VQAAHVVLVRRPSAAIRALSFGCTGCHRRNLMNPKRFHELDQAFVKAAIVGSDWCT
jgi:hypothetical protein